MGESDTVEPLAEATNVENCREFFIRRRGFNMRRRARGDAHELETAATIVVLPEDRQREKATLANDANVTADVPVESVKAWDEKALVATRPVPPPEFVYHHCDETPVADTPTLTHRSDPSRASGLSTHDIGVVIVDLGWCITHLDRALTNVKAESDGSSKAIPRIRQVLKMLDRCSKTLQT